MCGGWDDGSGGMQWQDADIRQDAQFPEYINELRMSRNYFFRFVSG